jgi:predicted amidohydrolase YtcJ
MGARYFPDSSTRTSHLWPSILYGGALNLDGVTNLEQVLQRVRAAASGVEPGTFVVAQGYDPWKLVEQRHPTRDELDAAGPDCPVLVIEYSFHEGAANSSALALAGMTDQSEPPRGGIIGRDRRGRLDGRLAETALYVVEAIARREMIERNQQRMLVELGPYQDRLFRYGITCVCDAAVPPQSEALYERALAEGRLRIPIVMMPISDKGIGLPPHDRLEGRVTGEGSELLKVGPLKLVFDGASRCAMCLSPWQVIAATAVVIGSSISSLSFAPIRDALSLGGRIGRDLRFRTGERFYTHAGALEMVRVARERGFSVGIHAIGNEAVEHALDALAAAKAPRNGLPPPRIEHGLAVTSEQARRAADLGVTFVLQPDFLRLPVFESLPRPPGLRFLAARTLLDAGVMVAGSSDAPASDFNPLDGVKTALRRRARSGRLCQPDESISVLEALCAYTRDAARACGVEQINGTLEVGKRADLVVLNRDPALLGADALDELCVEQTLLGGRPVYSAS